MTSFFSLTETFQLCFCERFPFPHTIPENFRNYVGPRTHPRYKLFHMGLAILVKIPTCLHLQPIGGSRVSTKNNKLSAAAKRRISATAKMWSGATPTMGKSSTSTSTTTTAAHAPAAWSSSSWSWDWNFMKTVIEFNDSDENDPVSDNNLNPNDTTT
jgi:hypothetical protein